MMSMSTFPWKRRVQDKWFEMVLPDQMLLEQWIVPAGTKVRYKESQNFGWLVVPQDTRDINGHNMPKHIFRY